MVTDSAGYTHLIEFLTDHLGIFIAPTTTKPLDETVMALFELQLSSQIMAFYGQHPELNFKERNLVVREVDAIVFDLEEILAGVANKPATSEQAEFINEFCGLIKNLFDEARRRQLAAKSGLELEVLV